MTPTGKFNAFRTIVTKEVVRFTRIWAQTLVPPVITMTLYLVIFGKLIGQRIGQMDGYAYMDFVVPGLVMMSVITSSYANVVSSFFSSKFQRSIEEMLVAPVPNYIIVLGFCLGGVLRGIITGTLVTLTSLLFTDLHIHHLGITLGVVLLTSVLFALGGFINAVYARNFDDISVIPTFVLTPLIYLGGVFYSIQLLPEFWQKVSLANPILYMVNAFRYGFLGVSDIDLVHAVSITLGFVVALFLLALHLLRKGVGIRS